MTTRPSDIVADVLMFGNRFLTQEGYESGVPWDWHARAGCPAAGFRRSGSGG